MCSGSARWAAGLVRVSLIAPIDDFVYTPIAVREAVGVGWRRRYPVWDLARDERRLVGSQGFESEVSETPPWPVDHKIVAAELGPYLAGLDRR